ncbi:MAG TPA: hypothetical protein VI172_01675 [Candidatus Dormibacteraeota bacterium]|jgi:hypothetical protein
MAEYTASREAALHAARTALADLKATGWQANPAYWVGRLEAALTGVLRSTDTVVPATGEYETGGCGAVDADDLDACGHCSDCTGG